MFPPVGVEPYGRLVAQRRRRKPKTNDNGIFLALTALVAIGVVWSVIKATHGLVLWIPVVLAALWIWRRIDRRQKAQRASDEAERQVAMWRAEEDRKAAELEAYRRSIARDLDGLLSLDPYEFEHAVAAVLRGVGWTDVEVTKGSGDRGIDVVGIDRDGWRTVVQCKRYSYSPVGGPDVRNLAGARAEHGADRAMLVTTATFTKQAYEAAERTQIELMDGEQLVLLARTIDATVQVLSWPTVQAPPPPVGATPPLGAPLPPPGWGYLQPPTPGAPEASS